MSAATPAKRVLADTTRNKANVQPSPRSVKKPKLEHNVYHKPPVKNAVQGSFGSSQPRSQFEEETLVKMSQDIEFNKQNSTEKDQQWSRPPLEDFNELENLCFQQIDAEEGVLNGGKATVKLFGVTEVSGNRDIYSTSTQLLGRPSSYAIQLGLAQALHPLHTLADKMSTRPAIPSSSTSHTSCTTSTSPRLLASERMIASLSRPS